MKRIREWARFLWTGVPPTGYDAADAWGIVIGAGCVLVMGAAIAFLLWVLS